MSRINTSLTRLLGVQVPLVCAPMAFAGGATLACEVTLGGGFGFLAAGYGDPQKLRDELALAREHLHLRATKPLPIGVGYLAWKLEESDGNAYKMIDAALDYNVQAVWFAFGTKIGQWTEYVRKKNAESGHKTLVFIQVNSVEEALTAVNEWLADALVAQGLESGGHGGSYAPSLFSFVSTLVTVIPADGPPILAAGGLSNGAQVAALLTLGAAGAVFGTRFLLTPESEYSNVQKSALLAANYSSTVRTLAFDTARSTLGWPKGVDGRGLRNVLVDDYDKGVEIDVLKEKLQGGIKEKDPKRMVIWAGQGVGQMNEIKPAQAIVRDLREEMLARLNYRQYLISPSL